MFRGTYSPTDVEIDWVLSGVVIGSGICEVSSSVKETYERRTVVSCQRHPSTDGSKPYRKSLRSKRETARSRSFALPGARACPPYGGSARARSRQENRVGNPFESQQSCQLTTLSCKPVQGMWISFEDKLPADNFR